MTDAFKPFMIEHQSGEILIVQSMFDAAGNPVTEDDERRKLALVVEAARAFWP